MHFHKLLLFMLFNWLFYPLLQTVLCFIIIQHSNWIILPFLMIISLAARVECLWTHLNKKINFVKYWFRALCFYILQCRKNIIFVKHHNPILCKWFFFFPFFEMYFDVFFSSNYSSSLFSIIYILSFSLLLHQKINKLLYDIFY